MSKLYYRSPETNEFKKLSTVLRGRQGEPGKDAYEVAVEEGFTGTRKEWLDSLKATLNDDVNSVVTEEVKKIYLTNTILGTVEGTNTVVAEDSAVFPILDMEVKGYTTRSRNDFDTNKPTIDNPAYFVGAADDNTLTITVTDGETSDTYKLTNLPRKMRAFDGVYDRIFLDSTDNLWKYGANIREVKYGKDGYKDTYNVETGSQYGTQGYRAIFASPITVPASRKLVKSDMFQGVNYMVNQVGIIFQYSNSIYVYPDMTTTDFTAWLAENSFTVLMKELKEVVAVLSDEDQEILNNMKLKYGDSTISIPAISSISVSYVKNTELYVKSELSNYQVSSSNEKGHASDVLNAITWGWNLGNTLDCARKLYASDSEALTRINTAAEVPVYENCWGNPTTTKEMIDTVKAAGCNAVRIPITWAHHVFDDENLTVSEVWMNRVKEVVGYVLDNDMYCIINTHHDSASPYGDEVGQGYLLSTGWVDLNHNVVDTTITKLKKLWTTIADTFKDYDPDKLIFEPFNEARDISANWAAPTWTNYEDYCKAVQAVVDTVRMSGGNNRTRVLSIQTYMSHDDGIEYYFEPSDVVENGFMVQLHTYQLSWCQDLEPYLTTVSDFFSAKHIPVMIGEFATNNTRMPESLIPVYTKNFISRAKAHGIKCFWWDDGKTYKLLNRSELTWYSEETVNALNNGLTETTSDVTYNAEKTVAYSECVYKLLSTDEGSEGTLVDNSDWGFLTLKTALNISDSNIIDIDMPYHDGYRIRSVAAYDANGNCILANNYKSSNFTRVILANPGDYASIRVCVFNPWGYRSQEQFKTAMETNQLGIYIKTATV